MRKQMSAEKASYDSDVCLEDRDVDVRVEVGPALGDQPVDATELGVVPHDGQRVQGWLKEKRI